jgi:hypothetical protein
MHLKNIPVGIFLFVNARDEGASMTALLEQIENWEVEEVRPCIASLGCWWREVHELEESLGYLRSSLEARVAWDELLSSEILSPQKALYVELRACVQLWQRISAGQPDPFPSLMDRLVWVAVAEDLPLPRFGILTAFRLRQRLVGIRSTLELQ